MDERMIMYFNKMSELVRILLSQQNIESRDIKDVLSDSDCEYNISFFNKFSYLNFNDDLQNGQLSLNMLNDIFFSKINYIIKERNIISCAVLLFYMDKWIYSSYTTFENLEYDAECYESLNDNASDTHIAILPKIYCNWDKKKITDEWEQILSYFYFVDYTKLKGMRFKNYRLDSNVVFGINSDVLKIAISPLTKEKTVNFSVPYTRKNHKTGAVQNLFRVENVSNESELEKLIIEDIINAGKARANILVFPEMLGTENMLNDILTSLRNNSTDTIPPLIVFPSIWKKSGNESDNTNRSCIIYDGEEVLFEQYKRVCFKYAKEGFDVYEDISLSEKYNEIHMLHIDGIGRFCVIICYDYLENQNRSLIMENMYPTLVCSPSFSTGSFDFSILSEKYFNNSCNWIWCNTCSASNETKNKHNFDIVGIVTTLNKHNDQKRNDSFKQKFDGVGQCTRQDCINCLFYADIPLSNYNIIQEESDKYE